MLYLSEPISRAELAYREEKIRDSFVQAEARRRYRLQRRRARKNRPANPHLPHRQPVVSR